MATTFDAAPCTVDAVVQDLTRVFINLVNNNYLDDKHPVFGRVTEGIDVVDTIAEVETNANDRPLQEVTIIKAELIS